MSCGVTNTIQLPNVAHATEMFTQSVDNVGQINSMSEIMETLDMNEEEKYDLSIGNNSRIVIETLLTMFPNKPWDWETMTIYNKAISTQFIEMHPEMSWQHNYAEKKKQEQIF